MLLMLMLPALEVGEVEVPIPRAPDRMNGTRQKREKTIRLSRFVLESGETGLEGGVLS